MAKNNYASYLGHHKITREPLHIGGDGPFFRNGKLNRDPHGAVTSDSPKAERKEVHVYHHGKDES